MTAADRSIVMVLGGWLVRDGVHVRRGELVESAVEFDAPGRGDDAHGHLGRAALPGDLPPAVREDPAMAIHITGDAAADQVLTDSPFALLARMMLEQHIPWEITAGSRFRRSAASCSSTIFG